MVLVVCGKKKHVGTVLWSNPNPLNSGLIFGVHVAALERQAKKQERDYNKTTANFGVIQSRSPERTPNVILVKSTCNHTWSPVLVSLLRAYDPRLGCWLGVGLWPTREGRRPEGRASSPVKGMG